MTKIPARALLACYQRDARMLIVNKLEVRKREFILDKGRQFVKDRLCPMAYKDNELIDIPSHATSWHLGIVTFKLCFLMFGLCLKVFFRPYLSVQMRIVDKGKPLVGCFLNHLRRYLFLTNTKKGFVLWIVPENTYARHLFIESLHVGHLLLMFFVCKLSHDSIFLVQRLCKANAENSFFAELQQPSPSFTRQS